VLLVISEVSRMPHSRQTQQIQYSDIQPPMLPDPLFTNFAGSCEHSEPAIPSISQSSPTRSVIRCFLQHPIARDVTHFIVTLIFPSKFQAANDESLRVYMRTHAWICADSRTLKCVTRSAAKGLNQASSERPKFAAIGH
jgi:hypothetical protein